MGRREEALTFHPGRTVWAYCQLSCTMRHIVGIFLDANVQKTTTFFFRDLSLCGAEKNFKTKQEKTRNIFSIYLSSIYLSIYLAIYLSIDLCLPISISILMCCFVYRFLVDSHGRCAFAVGNPRLFALSLIFERQIQIDQPINDEQSRDRKIDRYLTEIDKWIAMQREKLQDRQTTIRQIDTQVDRPTIDTETDGKYRDMDREKARSVEASERERERLGGGGGGGQNKTGVHPRIVGPPAWTCCRVHECRGSAEPDFSQGQKHVR